MKDVTPSILRGCFQMVSIRSRTPDVGHLAFTLEHFTSPLITRGFSVRTSAWGIAFCCFCAFCHRQGRLLFGQHYSLPGTHVFSPNTVERKGWSDTAFIIAGYAWELDSRAQRSMCILLYWVQCWTTEVSSLIAPLGLSFTFLYSLSPTRLSSACPTPFAFSEILPS